MRTVMHQLEEKLETELQRSKRTHQAQLYLLETLALLLRVRLSRNSLSHVEELERSDSPPLKTAESAKGKFQAHRRHCVSLTIS